MENKNSPATAASTTAARRRPPSPRLLALLGIAAILLVIALFASRFQPSASAQVYDAVDTLARLPVSEPFNPWVNPEVAQVRWLGPKAIPALRAILREKSSDSTRFLLWVHAKWPRAGNYYSHFPDPILLSRRRSIALAILETMGSDALPAVPELIHIIKSSDVADIPDIADASGPLNMLQQYANLSDPLDSVLESKTTQSMACGMVLQSLSMIHSPTPRTVRDLTLELSNPDPLIQQMAAYAFSRVNLHDPKVSLALKRLQSSSRDPGVIIRSSDALWSMEKDNAAVLPVVFKTLEDELTNSLPASPGLAVMSLSRNEESFLYAAWLFQKMTLNASEKSRALADLQSCARNSPKFFLREQLLPAMLQLGLPGEQALQVCRDGLAQDRDDFRQQAAALLPQIAAKYPIDQLTLDPLLQDHQVEVRVQAAKADWLSHSNASRVLPILIAALKPPSLDNIYYYDPATPAWALSILSDIGPQAKDAIPMVSELVNSPNRWTASAASNALRQIRRDSSIAP